MRADGVADTPNRSVTLKCSAGRVLARPIAALLDLPPVDQSTTSGYAVRYAHLAPDTLLPVQQRCRAGDASLPTVMTACSISGDHGMLQFHPAPEIQQSRIAGSLTWSA